MLPKYHPFSIFLMIFDKTVKMCLYMNMLYIFTNNECYILNKLAYANDFRLNRLNMPTYVYFVHVLQ
jgi:hypothetical protein